MRKIFLSAFLIMAVLVSNAQYVAFSAGPVFSKIRYKTFGYFADSYNRYHDESLTKELDPFNFATGKYIAFSLGSGPMGMDISYNNFRENTKAIFTTGESRIFKLRTGYFDMLLNLGAGSDDGFGIWATAGFTVGRINLISYSEYADGTINYSLNQILNGQFTGMYVAGILGLKAQIPVAEGIGLQLRADKLFKQVNYLSFKLRDKDNGRSNQSPATDGIPADYFHYNEIIASQTTLPEQYYVLPDVSALRFSIGVSITIGD